jgi:hypothetical protein
MIVLAAGVLAAGSTARASLLLALDTPALVERADAIAVVDVASAHAAWDARHERIVSTIDLTVVESWKGTAAPASRIVVEQPGGTVGDITMTVHGMPRFSPGERALVFLRGPLDRTAVVGLAQGKRLVRLDAAAGRPMVAAPDIKSALRPLDDLRAEVRALVARGGAR